MAAEHFLKCGVCGAKRPSEPGEQERRQVHSRLCPGPTPHPRGREAAGAEEAVVLCAHVPHTACPPGKDLGAAVAPFLPTEGDDPWDLVATQQPVGSFISWVTRTPFPPRLPDPAWPASSERRRNLTQAQPSLPEAPAPPATTRARGGGGGEEGGGLGWNVGGL